MEKLHLTWVTIVVAVAFVQWAVFAVRSLLAPAKSKRLMRPTEEHFLVSSGVLLVAWMVAFLPPVLAASKANKEAAVEASVSGARSHGSCASVQTKESAAEAEAKLGKPDEKLNDEAVRGPGATTWVYRDTRCAVHVMDNEVDFVE